MSIAWSAAFVALVAAEGATSVHSQRFLPLLFSKETLALFVLHAALVRLSIFAGFHAAVSVDRLHGKISFSNRDFESHIIGYSFMSGVAMMFAITMTREHRDFGNIALWLTMFSVWLPCHFIKSAYALNDREVAP